MMTKKSHMQIKHGADSPRHRLSTRLWHWINVLCLLTLLMSGLNIFNAHPRLYWGEYGANNDYAWLAIGSSSTDGYLRIGDIQLDTTGVLGNWRDKNGKVMPRAFPGWVTIPSYYSLADGRRWHFFFAWIFAISLTIFIIRSLWNRHIQRDLHIHRSEWVLHVIWKDVKDHVLLRFRKGADTRGYNILQKLTYNSVIFILLPLMIFSGLAMSPAMDANWPFLTDIFWGRQSARSIHFISAFLLVIFFLVHILMVLLSRPLEQVRSIITGGTHKQEEV